MIDYEQAGELLALAAARDQRTVGDADILAWHDDLNAAHVTYQEAREALTRFYLDMASRPREDRFRATPVDLVNLARRARRERLKNFQYQPPAGEDDPQYFARLRGQVAAVASGSVPCPAAAPMLAGGPHPAVAEELGRIGRRIPDDGPLSTVRRPGPLGVVCPQCKAPIGRPCKSALRGQAARTHGARRRVAAGRPAVSETPEEIERRRAASLAALERMAADEAGR